MMDVTAAHEGINGGGGGGEMMDTNSGDDEKRNNGGGEEGDKMNCGGNRWPRQETFALLKIRSDMDAAFRDSSLKGPLWEEVSRKLGELGYHRSAKKCKEKFENVYKYHKRTKESRSGKPEGKTYKFFDQLQALENHQFTLSSHTPTPTSKTPQPSSSLPTNTITLMQSTRPSIDVSETTISYVPPAAAIPSTNPTLISPPPPPPTNPRNVLQQGSNVPYSLPNMNFVSTTSTSSSTASDEDMEARYRKKRKWKDYFRRLTRQVLAEQEEMQKRFLEAIDKRERERVAQQEAWRIQEMARINREHDILVQERSTAAAKDAAVIAFLQKLSGQTPPPPPPPPPLAPQPSQPPPQVQPQQQQPQQQLQQPPLLSCNNNFEIQKMNNGSGHGQSGSPMSSSRWPKAEVHALIRLRTTLDAKYQENGPKGPLWEDISAGLQRLGYNRSAKRCKEKWENINKYFKKVKESSKQRREDSKTCPYFHELEVLYKEKSKIHNPVGSSFYNSTTKQPNEMMEPLMVQPEQQWRPPPPVMEEQVKEREGGIEEEEEEDIDDVEEDGDSVEDEERYEIATNKLSSVDTVE